MGKQKGGRPPKNADDRRTEPVGFRCTESEMIELRQRAGQAGLTVGEFCRRAALGKSMPAPKIVPEVNREAYADLARASGNLNQVVKMTQTAGMKTESLETLRKALSNFRLKLIGVARD